MDFFEQFMFNELVELYKRDNLNEFENEDLYERFTHLEYLSEVKPYLFAMRYFGRGTVAEPESVLKELECIDVSAGLNIRGVYLDLKIISGKGNDRDRAELEKCIAEGYSDQYLKEASRIHMLSEENYGYVDEYKDEYVKSEEDDKLEPVVFKSMIFEGCGYSGLYFTSGDIDYLNAKVFIEPVKTTRHLSVKSQIYVGDEPFSQVFSNEYTLKPGDNYFTTLGWGNKHFGCYSNRTYRWIIEFDGDENNTHNQEFRFYNGKIKKAGVPIKDIKLFSSKATGALESDREKYSASFERESLEYVYFKLFIEEPGQETMVQIFLKIMCLEDNSVFYNGYILQHLDANTCACWRGIGFNQKGKWKAGLYKYSIHIGTGVVHEGTFTVN